MNNTNVTNQPWDPQQPSMTTPPARKSGLTAFLWGSIFGGVLVICYLAYIFLFAPHLWRFVSLSHLDKSQVTADLVLALFSFFCLIFFLLGIIASSRTGKVSTGVLACIWTTLWVFLLSLLYYVSTFLLFAAHHPAEIPSNERSFIYLILSLIANLIIGLILDVVFGALGGLIGRASSRARTKKQPTPPTS